MVPHAQTAHLDSPPALVRARLGVPDELTLPFGTCRLLALPRAPWSAMLVWSFAARKAHRLEEAQVPISCGKWRPHATPPTD